MTQRNEQLMVEADNIVDAKVEDLIGDFNIEIEMKEIIRKIDEQLAIDYLDKPTELIGS